MILMDRENSHITLITSSYFPHIWTQFSQLQNQVTLVKGLYLHLK
jgi:hypothetical protein